jgi:flavodoxin
MNVIFVYYSATGNGDAIAQYFRERGHAYLKIDTAKPLGKMNFFKMLKYGKRAIDEKAEELAPYTFDANQYDEVILGSPIWGGRIATPMLTFIKNNPSLKDKVTFALFYSMSGNSKKAPQQLLKYCPNAKSVSLESPKEELDEMKRKVDQVL